MDLLMLVLRLIHIGAGVFWAGGAIMIAGFIEPTARSLGPEGGKFIQKMVAEQQFSKYMSIAALATVIAGVILYWFDSGGLQLAWITTRAGLLLGIGGLAGIIAFLEGQFVNAPIAAKMAAVAQAMQSAGGPPKPEQIAELQTLQTKLRSAGRRSAVLLTIAVIGMALARAGG